MTLPARSARPRLAPGCRLSESAGQPSTLLMPEGALKLNDPGLKIVQLCNGMRSVTDIFRELAFEFKTSDRHQIEEETLRFLELLHEKRAVDFE